MNYIDRIISKVLKFECKQTQLLDFSCLMQAVWLQLVGSRECAVPGLLWEDVNLYIKYCAGSYCPLFLLGADRIASAFSMNQDEL